MANLPTGPKGSVASKFTGGMEKNTHLQGRTGSKVPMKPGPATGRGSGNSTKGGGINRTTQGKS